MKQMQTYPEMNARVVEILRLPPHNNMHLYAAQLIKEQAAEIERLRLSIEQLELANETMTCVIQLAAYQRCDYCIYRTEPCCARGMNAECDFQYAEVEKIEGVMGHVEHPQD